MSVCGRRESRANSWHFAPTIFERGVGQAVGHLRFASAPDDTTLAGNRDRKLNGWFFSAAPFLWNNPAESLMFSILNKAKAARFGLI